MIKRYDEEYFPSDDGWSHEARMVERNDGCYVLYSDHLAELQRLEAQLHLALSADKEEVQRLESFQGALNSECIGLRKRLQEEVERAIRHTLEKAAAECLKYGLDKWEGKTDKWLAGYRACMEEDAAIIRSLSVSKIMEGLK